MKTTVFLVRHAECLGNVLKDLFVQGKGPRPDYLPGYRNSPLEPRGFLQSYLAGKTLVNHSCRVKRFYVSLQDRAMATAYAMANETALCPMGFGMYRLPCLNELSKSPLVKLAESFKEKIMLGIPGPDEEDGQKISRLVTSYYYFVVSLFLDNGVTLLPRELHTPYLIEAFNSFVSYAPEFFEGRGPLVTPAYQEYLNLTWDWVKEEREKEEWLKFRNSGTVPPPGIYITCDDGEDLDIEIRPRKGTGYIQLHRVPRRSQGPKAMLECYMYENPSDAQVAVVLHAKRLIRLRQEIEGFDEAEYQRLAKLNGQNFPQNTSITQYEYEDGVWTLIGEPYRLPRGLVIRDGTRRLGFQMVRSDFEAICTKLELDLKEVEDPLLDRLS